MSELLLVNGVTPELYGGSDSAAHPEVHVTRSLVNRMHGRGNVGEGLEYQVTLLQLFCCISSGQININTADPIVLQLVPGIDATTAQNIIQLRAGLDGVDGTADDVPFHNPGELVNVPGMSPLVVGAIQQYFTVRSTTFTVLVEARAGDVTRHYRALVRRNNPRDVALLFMETE
jgi:DNA uptake protein ComE-like DNA-binding protein